MISPFETMFIFMTHPWKFRFLQKETNLLHRTGYIVSEEDCER
jgi:hypothetical protein